MSAYRYMGTTFSFKRPLKANRWEGTGRHNHNHNPIYQKCELPHFLTMKIVDGLHWVVPSFCDCLLIVHNWREKWFCHWGKNTEYFKCEKSNVVQLALQFTSWPAAMICRVIKAVPFWGFKSWRYTGTLRIHGSTNVTYCNILKQPYLFFRIIRLLPRS